MASIKSGEKFKLKCGVEVEVVEYSNATNVLVQDSEGNRKVVTAGNLRKGAVGWEAATNRGGACKVGMIFKTKRWGDVEIVDKQNPYTVTVKFLNTGNIRENVACVNLLKGYVKDVSAAQDKKPMYSRNYVYLAKHNGKVVYIGIGTGDRYKHCTSGRSTSYLLNKLHFAGENVDIEVCVDGLSRQSAETLEKQLIAHYNPEGNTIKYL